MRVDVGSSSGSRMPTSNINQGGSSQKGISESNKIKDQARVENNKINNQNQKYEEIQETQEKKYTEDEVIDFIEKANDEFVTYDRKFEFSIHEKTKKIMVKVLDTTTDEIIREVPAEKLLDIVAGLWEVAGIMLDKKI